MSAKTVCPYCNGKLSKVTAESVKAHLDSCPGYDAKRPMTVDDMLAALGSAFRLGDRR